MAIETASYLSDLNIANPPGSDPVGQADDHIRLLKSVLKSTFPNITGAVTSTQTQLNLGVVPTGCILMWSGATTAVPTGYALCNGGTYSKSDGSGSVTVPDLRDRFIVGAGTTYAVAATGGATSNTPTITMANAAFTLTTNELPAHTHTLTDAGHTHVATQAAHSHTANGVVSTSNYNGGAGGTITVSNGGSVTTNTQQPAITVNTATTGITIASTGTGAAHTHANTATSSSVPTLPPYYALCFIYKL